MFISRGTSNGGGWELHADPPEGWGDRLRSLDGGFFHSPPGLSVGAPAGTPLYAQYVKAGQVLGLATGVRATCRISLRSRHVYFPSWPVLAPEVDRGHAIDGLAATLRDDHVAEARWDSYDAGRTTPAAAVPSRNEYVLPLDLVDGATVWPAATQHRRSVRRGDREGFEFRSLASSEATAALIQVLAQATSRAAKRGAPFTVEVPAIVHTNGVHAPNWGVSTYGAYLGDVLLAAALIGHGPTRAYYLLGGATPGGYALGASIWLHARIAGVYAMRGLREYNLGGAPATAVQTTDPSHGLHRFKLGFGARMTPCAGDRWDLHPLHSASHRLALWATGMLR